MVFFSSVQVYKPSCTLRCVKYTACVYVVFLFTPRMCTTFYMQRKHNLCPVFVCVCVCVCVSEDMHDVLVSGMPLCMTPVLTWMRLTLIPIGFERALAPMYDTCAHIDE
jgi:hypothetical protein